MDELLNLYTEYDIIFWNSYVHRQNLPGGIMKLLNLIMWVTQFGLSILFPLCFFLILGVWLQTKFALGIWIVVVLGILGFLTSISTVRSCLHSMQKAAREVASQTPPPIAFNDHK